MLPDKSVDMILCDLPYGTTACKWDTIIPFEPLWAQYTRIIKPKGAIVLTASQPFTSALVMSNVKWFKYEWIWDKVLPSGFQNSRNIPMKRHENVCVFYDKKPTYNPQMVAREKPRKNVQPKTQSLSNRMTSTKKTGEVWFNTHRFPTSLLSFSNADRTVGNHVHPTQKPVALFEYLIKTYTNPGDLILDNCAGSGTTGIAAINTDRAAILIEKEADYCVKIRNRVLNHVRAETAVL